MPECEVCDAGVEVLYTCKICGTKFCSSCGSMEDRLCYYCQEDEEEEPEYP